MTSEREYRLACVAEECQEVAERALKAIRFGLFEERPAEHGGTGLNNWQALAVEFEDLLTAMDVLIESEGLIFHRSEQATTAKREKIAKYLKYAQEVGQVERGACKVTLKAQIEQLVAKWRTEQVEYPKNHGLGNAAAAAVRLCADELSVLLDAEEGGEQIKKQFISQMFESPEPCPRCGAPLNLHEHSRPEGCIISRGERGKE